MSRFWVPGSGFQVLVPGSGFWFQVPGSGSRFRVQSSGFRVQFQSFRAENRARRNLTVERPVNNPVSLDSHWRFRIIRSLLERH
jgi:hypothetical protein